MITIDVRIQDISNMQYHVLIYSGVDTNTIKGLIMAPNECYLAF